MKKIIFPIIIVIALTLIFTFYLIFATDTFKKKVTCKGIGSIEDAVEYKISVSAILKDDIVDHINEVFTFSNKEDAKEHCESYKNDDLAKKVRCSGKKVKLYGIKNYADFEGNNLVGHNKQLFTNALTSFDYTCK